MFLVLGAMQHESVQIGSWSSRLSEAVWAGREKGIIWKHMYSFLGKEVKYLTFLQEKHLSLLDVFCGNDFSVQQTSTY